MGVNVAQKAAWERRGDLQARMIASAHSVLSRSGARAIAKGLFREIRTYLLNASDQRLIKEPKDIVMKTLLLTPLPKETYEISVGGVRNFKRDISLPHFTRKDGAWFDFQLLVAERSGAMEVLAYDYEIRFSHTSPFEFLRFDLNPPDSKNAQSNLRSHIHLNSDDDGYSIPMPYLTPYEALDLMLHDLRSNGRIRRLYRDDLVAL